MSNRPNIVVLDGHTMNPGDLTWKALEKIGTCRIYPRTAPQQVIERASKAELLILNKTVLSGETIDSLPRLKYIGVMATGHNIVDITTAARRNIPVTNVPAYGTDSVAQMVFAHLLHFSRRVAEHSDSAKKGDWAASPDWCYWHYPQVELNGLTMGIVGYGRIGRAVAALAISFGMRVICHTASPPASIAEDIDFMDFAALLAESDVISLHCPLTTETEHLINSKSLRSMKRSAILINTSRGRLIDEEALANALEAGLIAAAGLDVLYEEPPPRKHRLYDVKNCTITPHIAWATTSARKRLMETVIKNVTAFMDGTPQNIVNRV